jgi:hypothetical protein
MRVQLTSYTATRKRKYELGDYRPNILLPFDVPPHPRLQPLDLGEPPFAPYE